MYRKHSSRSFCVWASMGELWGARATGTKGVHLNNVATFNVYKLVHIIIIYDGMLIHSKLPSSRRPTTTRPTLSYLKNSIVKIVRRNEKLRAFCVVVPRARHGRARTVRAVVSVIPTLHKATAYFALLFNYKRIYCAEETKCWLLSIMLCSGESWFGRRVRTLARRSWSLVDNNCLSLWENFAMETFHARQTQNILSIM